VLSQKEFPAAALPAQMMHVIHIANKVRLFEGYDVSILIGAHGRYLQEPRQEVTSTLGTGTTNGVFLTGLDPTRLSNDSQGLFFGFGPGCCSGKASENNTQAIFNS
jgi:hypothetical protein